MTPELKILNGLVREKYGAVCWSHKIQEKQSEIYANRYNRLETLNIVGSAIVGGGILSLFFADYTIVKAIAAILSFMTAAIAAYFKSFDLKALAKNNKSAALKLLCIRDELKILLMEIKVGQSDYETLVQSYKDIQKRLDTIYQEAPDTTEKAVEMAKIALEVKKDNEITDEEIDRNLPEELKSK